MAYKVPDTVKKIASRALEYNNSLPISQRASYKIVDDTRVPGTGIRTARRLIKGYVTIEQINLMVAWFARHGEADKESKARQNRTSKAAIAWALWGGNPGRRWAKSIQKQNQ